MCCSTPPAGVRGLCVAFEALCRNVVVREEASSALPSTPVHLSSSTPLTLAAVGCFAPHSRCLNLSP
eukprot:12793086-Heterocapsa_arctica.AAC.1